MNERILARASIIARNCCTVQVMPGAVSSDSLYYWPAAEEGPPTEVWEAINELKVHRIDHGVGSLLDHKLLQHLKETRLPLTVCPLSNYKVPWVSLT